MPKSKRIPIAAARRIAEQYGYEQVIILAREPEQGWVTTYGVTRELCRGAAAMAERLRATLGWTREVNRG